MVVNCLENILSVFLFICNCLYFVTAGFVPNGLFTAHVRVDTHASL